VAGNYYLSVLNIFDGGVSGVEIRLGSVGVIGTIELVGLSASKK